MADGEQPRNVKELLVEAKDASELMIDLAYAAVFFRDDDMAGEVEELEERLDGYIRRLREISMLAARSPEDAEAMANVLHVAEAIDKIGQAASDRELLVEAKDASELMIDLAYAAVFFRDDDMAGEVEELEERLDGYIRRLREISMLAARSPEDAEAMANVLHVAEAIDKIGQAA